jgi:uncharacterized protein YegL
VVFVITVSQHPFLKRIKAMSLNKFTAVKARVLPVFVLADTSGSMSVGGKITALQESLNNMLATFAQESARQAEIQVCLITFGGDSAQIHLPLTAVAEIEKIEPLHASGRTPMGGAFALAQTLIEDQSLITSRDYRPVMVLASDGIPTDDWQAKFTALRQSTRADKATRFAMAIGGDANEQMLATFNNDPEAGVFKAHQARDIHRFFRAVTMSVTTRSRSQAPNEAVPVDFDDLVEAGDDDLGLHSQGQW